MYYVNIEASHEKSYQFPDVNFFHGNDEDDSV